MNGAMGSGLDNRHEVLSILERAAGFEGNTDFTDDTDAKALGRGGAAGAGEHALICAICGIWSRIFVRH
jgi:hypothetical protein